MNQNSQKDELSVQHAHRIANPRETQSQIKIVHLVLKTEMKTRNMVTQSSHRLDLVQTGNVCDYSGESAQSEKGPPI